MNIEYKSKEPDFINIQNNLYSLKSSHYVRCDPLSKASFQRIMLEVDVGVVIIQEIIQTLYLHSRP